jgi:hypothetical protein
VPGSAFQLIQPNATLDSSIVHQAIDRPARFQIRRRCANARFVSQVERGTLRIQAFSPQLLDRLLELPGFAPVEHHPRPMPGKAPRQLQA